MFTQAKRACACRVLALSLTMCLLQPSAALAAQSSQDAAVSQTSEAQVTETEAVSQTETEPASETEAGQAQTVKPHRRPPDSGWVRSRPRRRAAASVPAAAPPGR